MDMYNLHMKRPTMFILRGVPGSGKSTLAAKLQAAYKADVFEADMYFYKAGAYAFDPTKLAEAHAWCMESTMASLRAGRHVVVANTFCQDQHVQQYADQWQDVVVVQLDTYYGSIHNVPEYAIERMRQQLASTRITPHYVVT